MNAWTNHGGLRLWAVAGILTAFALRLYRLGADSLWYDETVSAFLSRLSPGEIVTRTGGDIHPPGYYLLLHGWRLLLHPDLNHGLEFGLAWPSVFWSMLIVVLVFAVGARLFAGRVGVLALWFAAVNPFHLWYGQEVRMYAQGAALGLLCLWCMLRWLDDPRRVRWLAAYALAAAAALYTLYYVAFLLATLAFVGTVFLVRNPGTRRLRAVWLAWAGAQLAIVLLYLPWLPTFWRQATDPPVPPWREPWTSLRQALDPLLESAAALIIGQSPPWEPLWPWAIATLLVAAIALVPPLLRHDRVRARALWLLLAYTVLPAGLMLVITAVATPLYHVRYLFTYAPAFAVIAAVAVDEVRRIRLLAGLLAGAALLIIAVAGDARLWHDPVFRADDHRGAVADLARDWRPGDVILVNAGWAYTALDTYWPTRPVDPMAAVAPTIARWIRLPAYAAALAADGALAVTPGEAHDGTAPIVVRTGSVDGAPALGWGDPASDFFAMGRDETVAALERVAYEHPRIWHYRIYDTVNDPDGVIRGWLNQNTVLLDEVSHPGRDYLRTQLLATSADVPAPALLAGGPVDVGTDLTLTAAHTPAWVDAGAILYAGLWWRVHADAAALPDLRTSLRLMDGDGRRLAQADGPAVPPTSTWEPGTEIYQPLALALPAALPPGTYTVELVVYSGATGAPLTIAPSPNTYDSQRLHLGQVQVNLPSTVPETGRPMARFDYIDLLSATPASVVLPPGGVVDMLLVWRPLPAPYRDTYDTVFELHDHDAVVQAWRRAAGGDVYPSAGWPAAIPVADWQRLVLREDLPPGNYSLSVRLERRADRLPLAAQIPRRLSSQRHVVVAEVAVAE